MPITVNLSQADYARLYEVANAYLLTNADVLSPQESQELERLCTLMSVDVNK